jgi:hypothetical protein
MSAKKLASKPGPVFNATTMRSAMIVGGRSEHIVLAQSVSMENRMRRQIVV